MSDQTSENIPPEECQHLPVLPLRDIVVFPHMVTPLFVGRPKSIHALEVAMEREKTLLLLTQKDPRKDDPETEDLYEVGTIGQIIQLLKLPDGTVKVLVEGKQRAGLIHLLATEECLYAETEEFTEEAESSPEIEAMTSLIPPAEASLRDMISTFQPWDSA